MWKSASIRTSSSRCCFVNLSRDLAGFFTNRSENSGVPVVLALESVESRTVYVSWSGELAVNRNQGFESLSSVVEIGKRFASALGLRDEEQIIVRMLDTAPSCTRAYIDPVTPDDWDILQIHATFLETHLLDQVRVVFPREELPIWINRNTYILIRIGNVEPDGECTTLEEFTEVAIAPKVRNKHRTEKAPALDDGKTIKSDFAAMTDEKQSFESENKVVNQEESISSRLYNFVSSILAGGSEESNNISNTTHPEVTVSDGSPTPTLSCCQTSFEHSNIDLGLRVQPFVSREKTSEPSTVFVCSSSFPHTFQFCCKQCNKVLPFAESELFQITGLRKLACPREVNARNKSVAVTEKRDRKSQQDVDTANKNSPNKESDTNQGITETQISSQSMVTVRLIITGPSGTYINKRKPLVEVLPGHIALPSGLCEQLGVAPLSVVRLVSNKHDPAELKGLILQPHRESLDKFPGISDDKILSAFQEWVSGIGNKPLVVTNGMWMSFPILCNVEEKLECSLSVLSHSDTKDPNMYCYLSSQTTEKVTVVVGQPIVLKSAKPLDIHKEKICEVPSSLFKNTIEDLGGICAAYSKCMDHLLISLGQRPVADQLGVNALIGLRSGTLLICGSAGCGKTSLAHAVCHQLNQWPTCAYISVVQCIPLRGKKVETIQKQLQQVFREAAWHQPSVILLDDLDQVISAPSPTQEIGGEALYRRRLVEVFKDLVRNEVTSGSKIAVVATSRSRDSLHPALISCRGLHIFQCCVELNPPDSDQREEILMSIINRKITGDFSLDFSSLAKKTEGFSSKDLSSLVDRVVHLTALRQTTPGSSDQITEEDFVTALKGFKPAALRGVTLHSAGDLGWSDVGGLASVKDALMETLLWPTKYASLFSKCPLRLRSGLLLYGPPGTGKTLLAGVVAKECGLNFISIKGPELLSKYIGASEQAVRDMFVRAQSAKPCILFFDEFDSLAPKRGHDSTGVTDRVVNQLLTQLDGVEGLQGVYILGATSRPDLIDTALLRPGRLDKCLYCGIPSREERTEILQALSRNLPLAQDTDLEAVANVCEEFTGADLKALLYNAQLESIHRTVGKVHLYGEILGDEEPNGSLAGDTSQNSTALAKSCDLAESGFGSSGTEPRFQVHWPLEGKASHGSRGDEERQIAQQLEAIEENYLRDLGRETSTKDPSNNLDNHKTSAVTISQSDLMKIAVSMVPSVSDSERRRYSEIYKSFVASRNGTFTPQMPTYGKATLA